MKFKKMPNLRQALQTFSETSIYYKIHSSRREINLWWKPLFVTIDEIHFIVNLDQKHEGKLEQ